MHSQRRSGQPPLAPAVAAGEPARCQHQHYPHLASSLPPVVCRQVGGHPRHTCGDQHEQRPRALVRGHERCAHGTHCQLWGGCVCSCVRACVHACVCVGGGKVVDQQVTLSLVLCSTGGSPGAKVASVPAPRSRLGAASARCWLRLVAVRGHGAALQCRTWQPLAGPASQFWRTLLAATLAAGLLRGGAGM